MSTSKYIKHLKQISLYGYLIPILILVLISTLPTAISQPSGNILRVALISEPRFIDPYWGGWNTGFLAAQVFDSLLQYDINGSITLGLAKYYEVLPNEGAYLFVLREGVKFHDGKPLTVEDVKYSFEVLIPNYDTFGVEYFANTTVEIINSTTVKIKPGRFLPAIQIPLIASIDCAILPKHLLEGKDYYQSDFITKPIGSGPFKFKEWVKGSHIIFVKNPDYWDKGKPLLDQVIIRFITDASLIMAALQAGEIDYVFRGLPYEAYSTLLANPKLEVYPSKDPPYKLVLQFNCNHSILSNALVRQAIAYAIDKKEIVTKVTGGLANVTYSFISERYAPTNSALVYEYNVTKAEELLDKAGYPRGKDGIRFTLELLLRNEPEEMNVGYMIRDYLSRVGIKVEAKVVEFGTWLDLQVKGSYDFNVGKYWIVPFWHYQLFTTKYIGMGAFTNTMFYSNPKVDSLFEQWIAEKDALKQKDLLVKIDQQLSTDLPWIPIYDLVWLNVKGKYVKGSDIPIGRYVFYDKLFNTYIEGYSTP
ncbi:MAG: ABC transporter substrate-binding protein, partial [Sulfolobales archaeon]|nr:ABC transporter substrate-binding protein [Sulfolobales archaeon]